VGQRISRAKQRIKASGAEFGMPPETERSERSERTVAVPQVRRGSTTCSPPAAP
jgi:predicted RNA polymerase sigma factor